MWRAKLATGDADAAWNLFIERYRPLILAVIRRTLRDADDDDVDDVFAELCASLSANGLARVGRYHDSGEARFSTWLVTIVHHQTIDWIRHREGRRRVTPPPGLSEMQQQILHVIVCERRSHIEAYELITQRSAAHISFGSFMKEVAATFEALERAGRPATHYLPGPPAPLEQPEILPHDALERSEIAEKLARALADLPADERLAIHLFVVDELPASAVARAVGWPNAKTVYNRVRRSLDRIRGEIERLGLGPRGEKDE